MAYQILHIEDSKSDADVVKRLIQKAGIDFSYQLASSESEISAALESFKPDVILCDHSLPSFNSKMAYQLCKESNPDLIFILVTGTVSEEFAVEMLKAGVDDYLLKANLLRLPNAIENAYSKRATSKVVEAYRNSLQESETHLRTIFNSTTSGFILVDKEYIILELNDRAKFFNKISFGRILKKNENILRNLPAYRRDEMQRNIDKTLQGDRIQYESVYPQSDGISIIFAVNLSPTINEVGLITGVCITFDDISKRKRVESALKESEQFNRSILASIDYHLAVINADGDILTVNKAWNKFSIQNGEPVINKTGVGRNYIAVCNASAEAGDTSALAALKGFQQVINKEIPFFEMEFPCHSQEKRRWFLLRILNFVDDSNKVLMMHIDISDLKNEMILKEKLSVDLIKRNKNLEQFSYIISHNLRAPVANILGLANIWNLPGLDDNEKDELALAMYESANRIDTVVKDINQVLQVSNDVLERKEEILFSRIVKDIEVEINTVIEAENIEIKCDFSRIEAFLTMKSYIYSIFYNLITNSIKFRQPETPCLITIESKLVENRLQLVFTDNGLGIDLQSRAAEIFGLYNRFHSHVEGKGIGLFIVKTQVEKLGGEISVKSEVNKGTEFKIEFELKLII